MFINNLKINYLKKGNGRPIIFLHGWGNNLKTFEYIYDELENDYLIYGIDLPGFGFSSEPLIPYKLDDYVHILKEFIKNENIKNPILVGHSFGGRIILKYCINNYVENIILINSAGIRPKRSLLYYFKIYIYKIFKKLNIKLNIGSQDYKNASNIMKKTLSNIVNEDLKKELSKIKSNTLLIWGDKDKITPLKDAYYFEDKIKRSNLAIIPNTGHYCYLENKNYFLLILNSYLASEVYD